MTDLTVERTPIPGLLVLRLPVHEDARGWFKENWQREKMVALGLPDFGPVQHNVAFNADAGARRAASTPSPGTSSSPSRAAGCSAPGSTCGRATRSGPRSTWRSAPASRCSCPAASATRYQTLEDATGYTYLVNDHWRPGADLPGTRLSMTPPSRSRGRSPWTRRRSPRRTGARTPPSTRCRRWPRAAAHPRRRWPGRPGAARRLSGGASGEPVELDVTDVDAVRDWPWDEYDVVLNAAAWTGVDAAEGDGRPAPGPPTPGAPPRSPPWLGSSA